jgi:hypothetical protein
MYLSLTTNWRFMYKFEKISVPPVFSVGINFYRSAFYLPLGYDCNAMMQNWFCRVWFYLQRSY